MAFLIGNCDKPAECKRQMTNIINKTGKKSCYHCDRAYCHNKSVDQYLCKGCTLNFCKECATTNGIMKKTVTIKSDMEKREIVVHYIICPLCEDDTTSTEEYSSSDYEEDIDTANESADFEIHTINESEH